MVSTSRCRHTPKAPFRGMQLVGSADEGTLIFQCANCGAFYYAPRCDAITATGSRCRNAAAKYGLCVVHRGVPVVPR